RAARVTFRARGRRVSAPRSLAERATLSNSAPGPGGRPPMPTPRSTLHMRISPVFLLAAGLAATAPRAVATPFFAAPFLSFDTGYYLNLVGLGVWKAAG